VTDGKAIHRLPPSQFHSWLFDATFVFVMLWQSLSADSYVRLLLACTT